MDNPRHSQTSNDHQIGERDTPGSRWFLFWPALLLLVYPLSLGPVIRFFGDSPLLQTLYTPLGFVYKKVPPFQVALDAYIGLWDKHW